MLEKVTIPSVVVVLSVDADSVEPMVTLAKVTLSAVVSTDATVVHVVVVLPLIAILWAAVELSVSIVPLAAAVVDATEVLSSVVPPSTAPNTVYVVVSLVVSRVPAVVTDKVVLGIVGGANVVISEGAGVAGRTTLSVLGCARVYGTFVVSGSM